MIEGVVFDLDGTLADTAELELLGALRRAPFDALRLHRPVRPKVEPNDDYIPPPSEETALSISGGHNRLPGELIARGYRVAIITRSPAAYASTLVGLLGLDAELLLASNAAGSVREKLERIATHFCLSEGLLLYVGDSPDDQQQAEQAGADFEPAGDDLPERLLDKLPCRFPGGPWRRVTNPSDPPQMNHACLICLYVLPSNFGRPPTHCPRCGYGEEEALHRIWPTHSGGSPTLVSIQDNPYLGYGAKLASFAIAEVEDRAVFDIPLRVRDIDALERSDDSHRIAAVAARSLMRQSSRHRERLQTLLFRHLPAHSRHSLLLFNLEQGLFGFDPRLVTQAELADDLRFQVARAAARLFPALRSEFVATPGSGSSGYQLISIWPYWTTPYGQDLWLKVKDWRGGNTGRSGPEVHQSPLRFMALVLAGHILEDSMDGVIVPAPCSPMTPTQPGQCSLRLAGLIGEYLSREVRDPLRKTDTNEIVYDHHAAGLLSWEQPYREAILVDDQITRGGTVDASVRALSEAGVEVTHVLTWSSTYRAESPTDADDQSDWPWRTPRDVGLDDDDYGGGHLYDSRDGWILFGDRAPTRPDEEPF